MFGDFRVPHLDKGIDRQCWARRPGVGLYGLNYRDISPFYLKWWVLKVQCSLPKWRRNQWVDSDSEVSQPRSSQLNCLALTIYRVSHIYFWHNSMLVDCNSMGRKRTFELNLFHASSKVQTDLYMHNGLRFNEPWWGKAEITPSQEPEIL